ncbi:MAG: shikimate 5-dehydrogenase [Thermonema sp.]|uniref:shikimate dehydrogenase family protein n=1 Tax=Thermonema sp. TaxID=2231181 RepID=UPI0021DCACAA|nr:shikimate dehydrogenase [Thermonema sp.]GIV38905.1 MAG: shikimate 5-dehydrogenase [Thermonema sp.]
MPLFGLIGYPLSHSFSKRYFTAKFEQMGLKAHRYDLFELQDIELFPALWKTYPALKGVNVTIPYKQKVIAFLDELAEGAQAVGAVNTIKKMPDGRLVGYNTDVEGFKQALLRWLPLSYFKESGYEALVLGTGGASKAVAYVLGQLGVPYRMVSRDKTKGDLTYRDIQREGWGNARLIVNTTPLGMSPQTETAPALPYEQIDTTFYLYDLVYNPPLTRFLKEGIERGAKIQNGLEMLYLQAEAAWAIWNQ